MSKESMAEASAGNFLGSVMFQFAPSRWQVTASPSRGFLVVTPGLAFDRRGNRLGRGGGYYDGFLRTARGDPALSLAAIGVCLSVQLVAEAPHDERDERVDGVATDEELILRASQ